LVPPPPPPSPLHPRPLFYCGIDLRAGGGAALFFYQPPFSPMRALLPCNLSFIPQPRNPAANQKKSRPTNTRRRRLSSAPQIPHTDTAWRHLWIWTPGSFFSGQMRNEGRQQRRLCFRSQTSPSTPVVFFATIAPRVDDPDLFFLPPSPRGSMTLTFFLPPSPRGSMTLT
jgi:hypothetical protein